MATTDWTFYEAGWNLDTGTYVSSPSSLRNVADATGDEMAVWFNGDTSIREGRIETSVRFTSDTYQGFNFIFRVQHTDSINLDFYYIRHNIANKNWQWGSWDSGGSHSYVGITPTNTSYYNKETWYKFRVTWWEGRDAQNVLATAVDIDDHDGSNWTQIGTTLYDTNRQNQGSETNIVGIFVGTGSAVSNVDDTVIYKG